MRKRNIPLRDSPVAIASLTRMEHESLKLKILGILAASLSFGIAIKTMDEVFGIAIDRYRTCYQWPIMFNEGYWHTRNGCMDLWGAEIICFVWMLISFIVAVALALQTGRPFRKETTQQDTNCDCLED